MFKIKAFAIVAACALAAPVLVSAQEVGSVGYLLDYARGYLAEGKKDSAANYAREALALDPTNAEALAIIRQSEGRSTLETALPGRKQPHQAASAANDPGNHEVGSAGYFLAYARGFMSKGNFSSAADYARDALKVDPSNPEALAIVRTAQQRSPRPARSAESPAGGNAEEIGSAAYLLQYAKYHFKNGAYSGAADYARQALAIDPNLSEAKQILALSKGRRNKGSSSNSCEAQFGTCWAGATTFTPGSGYSADNARRQQCFVLRNICNGAAK